jgi:hypothetical protein
MPWQWPIGRAGPKCVPSRVPLNATVVAYRARRTKTRAQPRPPNVILVWRGPLNGLAALGHPLYTGVVAGTPDMSHRQRHIGACPIGHAYQRHNSLNGGQSALSNDRTGSPGGSTVASSTRGQGTRGATVNAPPSSSHGIPSGRRRGREWIHAAQPHR